MRSLLVVEPAADLDAALRSGADALVFDVAAGAWADALARANADLRHRPKLVVRCRGLDTGRTDEDLAAVMASRPQAILLPGTVGARDVQHLAAKLAVHEAEAGLDRGSSRIIASIESARGVLAAGSLPLAGGRLAAVAWDAQALAAEMGIDAWRDAAPLGQARGLVVLAAAAAGVPALDGISADGADVGADCDAAARDGFKGKVARDAADVATILARFGGGAAR